MRNSSDSWTSQHAFFELAYHHSWMLNEAGNIRITRKSSGRSSIGTGCGIAAARGPWWLWKAGRWGFGCAGKTVGSIVTRAVGMTWRRFGRVTQTRIVWCHRFITPLLTTTHWLNYGFTSHLTQNQCAILGTSIPANLPGIVLKKTKSIYQAWYWKKNKIKDNKIKQHKTKSSMLADNIHLPPSSGNTSPNLHKLYFQNVQTISFCFS